LKGAAGSLSSLQSAFDARRQRVIISESTINWVKWAVVGLLAGLILVTVAIIHSDNRVTAAISMTILSIAIAASTVLIASTIGRSPERSPSAPTC